ncbi:ArsA family ATPase [Streptomyces sp. 8N706]|uniref:ArsA family ATPase n=1 Tax=Streptomyces sp. 8N706 TaxID=3457416 RepID=UPI003FD3EC15
MAARGDRPADRAARDRGADRTAVPTGSLPWLRPVRAAPGLWAARIDSGEHLRTELLALQERAAAALDLLGAVPLDREEVTELPGAPQLALLRALQAVHALTPSGPGERGPGAHTDTDIPSQGRTQGSPGADDTGAPGAARVPGPGAAPPYDAGGDVRPPAGPGPRPQGQHPCAGGETAEPAVPGEHAPDPSVRPEGPRRAYPAADSGHASRGPSARPDQSCSADEGGRSADEGGRRTADVPHPAGDSGSPPAAVPPAAWDVVIVDMPPTPEALALLALPEQLRRYLRRLLPPERRAARALRPMLAQLAGVPMPARWLYEAADRCARELAVAQAVVESDATSVRIVIEPGPAGADALRTARAGLALYGLHADAVVANRLLPTGSADPWLAAASGRQQTALKSLYEDVAAGTALCEVPHLGHDPRGRADLEELVERATSTTLGGQDGAAALIESAGLSSGFDTPATAPAARAPGHVEDRLAEEGVLLWRLPLPGAERDDLDLSRRGDELVVTVGPFRRILPLPSALRRCAVSGAGLADGELTIRLTPDPGLWPLTARTPPVR